MKPGVNKILIGQAGEWFAVANLLKGGIHVHRSAKNWPGYDLLATSPSGQRSRMIEVKSTSSTSSTYGANLATKSADFVVMVSRLRANTAPKASLLGSVGAESSPNAFVVPRRAVRHLMHGSAFRIQKAQEHRYADKWGLLKLAPERSVEVREIMRRKAEQHFVACHFARCGFHATLGSPAHVASPVMIGLDRSIASWDEVSYLSWIERRRFSRGHPVLIPVDVRPLCATVTLLSCEEPEIPGAIVPTDHYGLVALIDVHNPRPLDNLVIFDREFLRRRRRSKKTWNVEELAERYRAERLPWAA